MRILQIIAAAIVRVVGWPGLSRSAARERPADQQDRQRCHWAPVHARPPPGSGISRRGDWAAILFAHLYGGSWFMARPVRGKAILLLARIQEICTGCHVKSAVVEQG